MIKNSSPKNFFSSLLKCFSMKSNFVCATCVQSGQHFVRLALGMKWSTYFDINSLRIWASFLRNIVRRYVPKLPWSRSIGVRKYFQTCFPLSFIRVNHLNLAFDLKLWDFKRNAVESPKKHPGFKNTRAKFYL